MTSPGHLKQKAVIKSSMFPCVKLLAKQAILVSDPLTTNIPAKHIRLYVDVFLRSRCWKLKICSDIKKGLEL